MLQLMVISADLFVPEAEVAGIAGIPGTGQGNLPFLVNDLQDLFRDLLLVKIPVNLLIRNAE